MSRDRIKEALDLIFSGINILQTKFAHRRFTIDGRLVGDTGEIIAAAEFDIILDDISRPKYDAKTRDERDLQIKGRPLSWIQTVFGWRTRGCIQRSRASYYNFYRERRRGLGDKLLSLPISALRSLSAEIADTQRVPKRVV